MKKVKGFLRILQKIEDTVPKSVINWTDENIINNLSEGKRPPVLSQEGELNATHVVLSGSSEGSLLFLRTSLKFFLSLFLFIALPR